MNSAPPVIPTPHVISTSQVIPSVARDLLEIPLCQSREIPRCARDDARGFTLIEVLLALSVIAIALTALLKVSHQNVSAEIHLKDKLISTWIADDALTQIKLKMVTLSTVQDSTFTKEVFKTRWYWRAHVSKTTIPDLDKIVISVSQKQAGPFTKTLVGYR